MENASKALIIAGAILLSILLISLGIMVYNNAKSTVGSADMSETEMQAFNGKFSSYLGTNVTANQVYSLCETVQTSNQSEATNGTKRYVKVSVTANAQKGVDTAEYGLTEANGTPTAKNIKKLSSSQTYTVTASTYVGSRISVITVTAN